MQETGVLRMQNVEERDFASIKQFYQPMGNVWICFLLVMELRSYPYTLLIWLILVQVHLHFKQILTKYAGLDM